MTLPDLTPEKPHGESEKQVVWSLRLPPSNRKKGRAEGAGPLATCRLFIVLDLLLFEEALGGGFKVDRFFFFDFPILRLDD